MKNSQKGFVTPLLLAIIAILLIGGGAYVYMQNKQVNSPAQATSTTTQPVLTQEQAQALVLQTWGGCTPDTCGSVAVTVQNSGGQYTVTALYEGLRDDSTSAQKKVAPAYYSNNVWSLGNATVTQRCQPGRGHQDFSSVLCF